MAQNATVLKDFQRTVRDEPWYYVYTTKIWVVKDSVEVSDVLEWLQERYIEENSDHRYRICTYKNKDGNRYVDYILMESCDDNDLVFMKLRWGFSKTRVARGNKVFRKRLNKEQKSQLNLILDQARADFYASLTS